MEERQETSCFHRNLTRAVQVLTSNQYISLYRPFLRCPGQRHCGQLLLRKLYQRLCSLCQELRATWGPAGRSFPQTCQLQHVFFFPCCASNDFFLLVTVKKPSLESHTMYCATSTLFSKKTCTPCLSRRSPDSVHRPLSSALIAAEAFRAEVPQAYRNVHLTLDRLLDSSLTSSGTLVSETSYQVGPTNGSGERWSMCCRY